MSKDFKVLPSMFDFNIKPFEPPKLPKYQTDCEFIDQCKYINSNCIAGATAFKNTRCSQERINQMLDNKELIQKPSINIEGSNNVQVNQQGANSTNNQNQNISIEQIPTDLIDEFKELISVPANNNRTKWTEFFQKFTEIGGSVTTLIKLFELFTNG